MYWKVVNEVKRFPMLNPYVRVVSATPDKNFGRPREDIELPIRQFSPLPQPPQQQQPGFGPTSDDERKREQARLAFQKHSERSQFGPTGFPAPQSIPRDHGQFAGPGGSTYSGPSSLAGSPQSPSSDVGFSRQPPPSYGSGDGNKVDMPVQQMQVVSNQPAMAGGMAMSRGMQMATNENSWMVPLAAPLNCPPGLEYLAEIDQLLIHQQIELLEVITGFETNNKYMIKNSLGQSVYYAAEDSGICNRNCLGPIRPFDMNFHDHYGNIVMHMYRACACDSCCFPCCLQNIEVSAPPGNIIGTVEQNWSIFFPRFSIKDVNGNTVLKIHGPFWTMSCCCSDVNFKVMTGDGKTEIGLITKQWSGVIREAATDADNFGVTFPMDLDVTAKALLLAAVFLIDFMYFETNNN